jgi:hypothetical protein
MKGSPEIEALIRRFHAPRADDAAGRGVLSNLVLRSPDFLGIGTDADEW